MSIAFIGLGSNLGDREAYLHLAIDQLNAHPEIEVVAVSSLYETPPWGNTEQGYFLNAVAQLQTRISPELLLVTLMQLEQAAGRDRTARWGPRTLDLDLLCYDDRQLQLPNLHLPHPHWSERLFVLIPWMEISPNWVPAGQNEAVAVHARKQLAIQDSGHWPVMMSYQIT
ncbi:MAG: 2-amino-4-hydroxy-6-hydroxymethyldihydropteridine diphosphokinase [Bacteroidetes bacterium]|nr:2-amino-4-hydroxy-6-hydroxymethyldihydropteridine diphosphokinase [Bacteroidota bacterium]